MSCIRVETSGLYHYEVEGKRAAEAATDLSRRLDFISRNSWSTNVLLDIEDARNAVVEKFGVTIRAVAG